VSDFLARMARRALRQAPVVEPLVRSRYEPVDTLVSDESAAPPVAPASLAALAPVPVGPRPLEPAAQTVPARPGRSRRELAVPPPPAVAESTVAEAGIQPVSPRRERAADAQGSPTKPAAWSPREAEPEAPPPLRARATEAAVEPLDVEETHAAVRAATPRREPADDAEAPPAPARLRGDEDAREDVPASESLVPEVVGVPETERLELVMSPPREAEQPRLARRAQTSEPDPEPVRVTIGRVEVVAPPPAPVAAPPSPTAPRLSLDEYLRTRGGLER
jgi:hypothetical protein